VKTQTERRLVIALTTVRDAAKLLSAAWNMGHMDADDFHDVLDALNALMTAYPLCPSCGGEGRVKDKTGGGHHGTCKTCGGKGVAS